MNKSEIRKKLLKVRKLNNNKNLVIKFSNFIKILKKEKKLNLALAKLKNLNLKNPDVKKNIENLSSQKNQLEIEKQEIEEKYKSLINDYNSLSKKLDELQNQEKTEQKRQIEFSEKIDELNQETDILLDEIDKWQT